MDIRIGIANTARELSFESSQTPAEIENVIEDAFASESKFIRLTDDKGKVYLVPTAAFSYIEIGSDFARRVGFVA